MKLAQRVARLEVEVMLLKGQKERKSREHGENIRKALCERREKGLPLGRPSKVNTNRVVELWKSGLTYREIAREMGIGTGTAYYHVHKTFGKEYESCQTAVERVQKALELQKTEDWLPAKDSLR